MLREETVVCYCMNVTIRIGA
uniref:Uncharacterized protein n=1 Tax=Anguilla anguilla TaxID=7936 RepID=A0A0E9T3D9_ANGAN